MSDQYARTAAARLFIHAHRRRRRHRPDYYRPEPLLSAWCAWEDARDRAAVSVADDYVKGFTASLEADAATYRVVDDRNDRARARYVAAEQAKRVPA